MARNRGLPKSNRCGLLCLDPLTFHRHVLGDQVSLSHSGRIAQRTENTFKDGLVFSSRPVKVKEKVRLRVQSRCEQWHGAMRVGFTTVPPMARARPLPSMAIPELTDTFGHWACSIHDAYCHPGMELEFWVSSGGSIYIQINNSKYKCLEGVDISQPLWAMIDVYGKTRSILLLGSVKRNMFWKQKSCPKHLNSVDIMNYKPNLYTGEKYHAKNPGKQNVIQHQIPKLDSLTVECVACMAQESSFTLQCGHQCLCLPCAVRVIEEIGTCPLCRRDI